MMNKVGGMPLHKNTDKIEYLKILLSKCNDFDIRLENGDVYNVLFYDDNTNKYYVSLSIEVKHSEEKYHRKQPTEFQGIKEIMVFQPIWLDITNYYNEFDRYGIVEVIEYIKQNFIDDYDSWVKGDNDSDDYWDHYESGNN